MKITGSFTASFLLLLAPTSIRADYNYSVVGEGGICASASGAFYDFVYYEGLSSLECAMYSNHLAKEFTVVGYETYIFTDFIAGDCYILLDNPDPSERDQIEAAAVPGFSEVLLEGDFWDGSGPIESSRSSKCMAFDSSSNTSTPVGDGFCGDANSFLFDTVAFDIIEESVCEELAASLATDLDVVGYEIGLFKDCGVILNNGSDVDQVQAVLPANTTRFNNTRVDVSLSGSGPVSTILSYACYKSEPSQPSTGTPVEFKLRGPGVCIPPVEGFHDSIYYDSSDVADCRSNAEELTKAGIEVVGFNYFDSSVGLPGCRVLFKSLYAKEGTFDFFAPDGRTEINLAGTSVSAVTTTMTVECFRFYPGPNPYRKVGDGYCANARGIHPTHFTYVGTGTVLEQRCEEAADFMRKAGNIPVVGYEIFTYQDNRDQYECSILLGGLLPVDVPGYIKSHALDDDTMRLGHVYPETGFSGSISNIIESSCYSLADGSFADEGSSAANIIGVLLPLLLAGWTGYLLVN